MRVLRVIASVNPEQGGPVEGLKASATLMAEAGHTTEVVTLDDPASRFVAEFPIPVHGQGPAPARYGYTPRLGRWVADNAGRFDVAVVHGLWNHASIGGWRGLKKGKLPFVVFTHGMMDPWFRQAYPLKHWAKQAFWLAAQGWVLKDAKAVLFTSEEERRLAATAFVGPQFTSKVVAYGAAKPPDRPAEQRAAFRAQVPQLGNRNYVLFLSRIHPKKGCDLLVAAFAKCAVTYPDVDLVIAGPDQVGLRSELMRQSDAAGLSTRIHWPGMLQGDAKWGAFRDAEAFILPSHQENFGIVVAEAMACGTPVLISDKVNICREVQSSQGGMVAPDTLAGTSDLFNRFLQLSDAERQLMREAARRGYDRHFDLSSAATDLTTSLELAMAEPS